MGRPTRRAPAESARSLGNKTKLRSPARVSLHFFFGPGALYDVWGKLLTQTGMRLWGHLHPNPLLACGMIFATQLRLPQRCDKNGCGCWFFSCLIGIWNQVEGRASYWFIIVVVKKVCACFGCQRIYCNAKNINLSMMRRFECSQGPAIPSILLGFLPWGVSCT